MPVTEERQEAGRKRRGREGAMRAASHALPCHAGCGMDEAQIILHTHEEGVKGTKVCGRWVVVGANVRPCLAPSPLRPACPGACASGMDGKRTWVEVSVGRAACWGGKREFPGMAGQKRQVCSQGGSSTHNVQPALGRKKEEIGRCAAAPKKKEEEEGKQARQGRRRASHAWDMIHSRF